MSTSKSTSRKEHDKSKKLGRLAEKAMSFHGQAGEEMVGKLRRPRTQPDLISSTGRVVALSSTEILRPKLTKLLLNVTVERSVGPVQVLISLESTVGDLVSAALRQYSKEGRRPILPSLGPSGFGLHYSQFSLESLDPNEKLIGLGSRNFFMCPKRRSSDEVGSDNAVMTTTSSTCSTEATKTGGGGWLRFINLSL
ncbi:hypothetical protein OSB04_026986 [Centaurea solstitialis]|uniref:DUF7054 domain-containing protein n=1 Tax=Centaurea solstitialis TaxID=347529 RepID=A0AA38SCY1_9ASTR|nr:hypothetical protein OSB04_026986 [Centaurea solstitialis]